jgi:squalene cyclase
VRGSEEVKITKQEQEGSCPRRYSGNNMMVAMCSIVRTIESSHNIFSEKEITFMDCLVSSPCGHSKLLQEKTSLVKQFHSVTYKIYLKEE